MKRTLLFVIVVVLAGMGFAAWRGHAQKAQSSRIAPEVPLKLDTVTTNILAHPTKVETFRLADFHEGETRTEKEMVFIGNGGLGTIDDHTIIHYSQRHTAGRRLCCTAGVCAVTNTGCRFGRCATATPVF